MGGRGGLRWLALVLLLAMLTPHVSAASATGQAGDRVLAGARIAPVEPKTVALSGGNVTIRNVVLDCSLAPLTLEVRSRGAARIDGVTIRGDGCMIIVRATGSVTIENVSAGRSANTSIIVLGGENVTLSSIVSADSYFRRINIALYTSGPVTAQGLVVNTLSVTGASRLGLADSVLTNLRVAGVPGGARLDSVYAMNATIILAGLKARDSRIMNLNSWLSPLELADSKLGIIRARESALLLVDNSSVGALNAFNVRGILVNGSWIAGSVTLRYYDETSPATGLILGSTLWPGTLIVKVRGGTGTIGLAIVNSSLRSTNILVKISRDSLADVKLLISASNMTDYTAYSPIVGLENPSPGASAELYLIGNNVSGGDYKVLEGNFDRVVVVGNRFTGDSVDPGSIEGAQAVTGSVLYVYNDFYTNGITLGSSTPWLLSPKWELLDPSTGERKGPAANYVSLLAEMYRDTDGDGVLDSAAGSGRRDPQIEVFSLTARPVEDYVPLESARAVLAPLPFPSTLPALVLACAGNAIPGASMPAWMTLSFERDRSRSTLYTSILAYTPARATNSTLQDTASIECRSAAGNETLYRRVMTIILDRSPPVIVAGAPRWVTITPDRLAEAASLGVGIEAIGEPGGCTRAGITVVAPEESPGPSEEEATRQGSCSARLSLEPLESVAPSGPALVAAAWIMDAAGNVAVSPVIVSLVPVPPPSPPAGPPVHAAPGAGERTNATVSPGPMTPAPPANATGASPPPPGGVESGRRIAEAILAVGILGSLAYAVVVSRRGRNG